MNREEYKAYNMERQRIISRKRSLRMQGLEYSHIETPDKIAPLMGYELTNDEGTYQGFTTNKDEAETSGFKIKIRPAL